MSSATMGQQLQSIFNHTSVQSCKGYSKNIFSQLHRCHTAGMGMHYYKCDDENCNHVHCQYHSCGNRHCPNCGGLKKEQWIENLTADLLPTSYYHLVFTLPHELHPIILGNRKALFKLLFDAATQTLLQFSKDPQYLGATCSITAILHTWGQQLSFHPHLHCIVSGGGVNDNKWIEAGRKNDKFLFPVKAMQQVYKAIFLKGLRWLMQKDKLKIKSIDTEKLIKKAGYKKWNVYAKSPFGNVASVVEYLGRYTHKVAITKHRIVNITGDNITFKYKDYGDGNRGKEMTLSIAEFLRRFELHFLPKRFVKIRHYGFLQNHSRTTRLNAMRKEMQLQPQPPKVEVPVGLRMLEQYGEDISLCPKCRQGRLILVGIVYPGQKIIVKRCTSEPPANKGSP